MKLICWLFGHRLERRATLAAVLSPNVCGYSTVLACARCSSVFGK